MAAAKKLSPIADPDTETEGVRFFVFANLTESLVHLVIHGPNGEILEEIRDADEMASLRDVLNDAIEAVC